MSKTKTLWYLRCNVCGRSWHSIQRKPLRCGKCKTPYWARARKEPR